MVSKHSQGATRRSAIASLLFGLLAAACAEDNPADDAEDAAATGEDAAMAGQDADVDAALDASAPALEDGSSTPQVTRDAASHDAAMGTGAADAAQTDAGARDAAADAALDASSCTASGSAADLDVTRATASGADGGAATKGAALALTLMVENRGSVGVMAKVTPRLESLRFSDYSGVPLGQTSALLCPGSNTVRVVGGPFLSHDQKAKHYALGSGEYRVASVTLEVAGSAARDDTQLDGARFRVETSNALLVPVVYDARYFQQIQGLGNTTPEAFLTRSFTRKNEIFTPSGGDPDGAGNFEGFAGGFDQMMNVRHLFRLFPGFPGENTTSDGWCEDAAAYAVTALGLAGKWDSQPAGTRPERHGFDYLMALTPDMGGGVACGWLDVQVSSLINRDVDRQQVIAVHETGHIFGAPHCDDVGNGAGGSLQGYVMCSGEKHAHYPDAFVWHSTSRASMRSHWD